MVKKHFLKFANHVVNIVFTKPHFYKILSGPAKNLFIYCAPRHGIKKIIGTYEKELLNCLTKLISKGENCIDIGAHIGYISLAMRRLVGEKGHLHIVEPIPHNCSYIKKTFDKNKFENVEILQIGLGKMKTSSRAHVFEDSGMANFADSGYVNYASSDQYVEFEIDTLDNLFADKKIDFIKIDVEGYEANVLEGGLQLLKTQKPTILVEIHNEDNFLKVTQLLSGLGYSFFDLNLKAFSTDSKFTSLVHLVAKT